MSCSIKVLERCSMLSQILTFQIRVFTEIKMIAFNFRDEIFIWCWSIWIFLGISNLKLCFSCKSTSSNIKWTLKTFVIYRLSRLMSSCFNRLTSGIICCVIHVWIITKLKVWFLKVFALLFIGNLFFIISCSWNTLFDHRMRTKFKMSFS